MCVPVPVCTHVCACVYSFIWQVCGYLNFVFIRDVLCVYVCVCDSVCGVHLCVQLYLAGVWVPEFCLY